ncbi:MAG: hypothetical protein IKH34_03980 [Oscillospiraceae bacterium]|nr:hypothetical protein [Oscillospiraceae bacterium]
MTLDEMNAHLDLLKNLAAAREALEALQAATLSSSRFDSLPRIQCPVDRTADLGIKIAEQRETVSRWERLVEGSSATVNAWINSVQDNRLNVILYLRFICGYEWQQVADLIGGKNTEAAVKSLVYRFFRSQAL